jgi:hypothetical protein
LVDAKIHQVVVEVIPNDPPFVDAGADKNVLLSAGSVAMTGNVTDTDGVDTGTVDISWALLSGPLTGVMDSPNSPTSAFSYSEVGTYVWQLTADDGFDNRADTVTVNVSVSSNNPPVVNAGPDQTVVLPYLAPSISVPIDASATDDVAVSSVTWTKVSGPGTVVFTPNANTIDVTAKFNSPGVYTLRLTAVDGSSISAHDDVVIIVQDAVKHGQVTLSWNPVVGAARYNVYRDGSLLSTIQDTLYTESLPDRITHQYRVEAVNAANVVVASSHLTRVKSGNKSVKLHLS